MTFVAVSVVIQCVAGSAYGGAVYTQSSIVAAGGIVRNNSAVVAGSGQARGGGLSAVTAVTLNGTLLETNSAVAQNANSNGTVVSCFSICRSHCMTQCTGQAVGGAVVCAALTTDACRFYENVAAAAGAAGLSQGGCYGLCLRRTANSLATQPLCLSHQQQLGRSLQSRHSGCAVVAGGGRCTAWVRPLRHRGLCVGHNASFTNSTLPLAILVVVSVLAAAVPSQCSVR